MQINQFLFGPYTVTAVMAFSMMFVGLRRRKLGGPLLSPDLNVKDAINGVGAYLLVVIWATLLLGPMAITSVLEKPFGTISVNGSFLLVIFQRLDALKRSAATEVKPKTKA